MSLQAHSGSSSWAMNPSAQSDQMVSPGNGPVDLHPPLEKIRQMKEFEPWRPSPLDEWLKQPLFQKFGQQINHVLEMLGKRLQQLLTHLHVPGVGHLPENIRNVFSGFVGFIIILLGLFALYLVIGLFLRWTERQSASSQNVARVFDETQLISSTHHVQQAQHCAKQGKYTEGVRQWYLALLCLLDETQRVPFLQARTNQEYSGLLLAEPMLQADFDLLSQQFEMIRYGKSLAQESQFVQCGHWYDAIQKRLITYV